MSEIADASAASYPGSRTRWRFSLRTIFLVTLIVALCLADFRLRGASWGDTLPVLKSLITAALIIGLLMQSRDFWRELQGEGLSADTRSGLWFAIAWRFAVSAMLVLYHVLDHFNQAAFLQPESAAWSIEVLHLLALVVIICSTRQVATRRARRRTSRLGYVVAWIVGIGLGSWLLLHTMWFHSLVHVAILGIELAHPVTKFPFLEGIDPLPVERSAAAFWVSMGAAVLVPVNYILIYLLARTNGTRARRIVCLWLFLVTFLGITGLFLWNYLVALPAAAPLMMQQESEAGVWHFSLIGLPCLLTFATLVAYRWTRRIRPAPVSSPAPTSARTTYLHERRWLLAMLLGIFLYYFAIASDGWTDFTVLRDEFIPWYERLYLVGIGLVEMVAGALLYPPLLLVLLVVPVVLVQGTLGCWRTRHSLAPVPPPELPAGRFAVVWLMVAATTLVALPVLAIYGFALWLAPWYL